MAVSLPAGRGVKVNGVWLLDCRVGWGKSICIGSERVSTNSFQLMACMHHD